jgi:DNA-binding MarR family transcriptional regulator
MSYGIYSVHTMNTDKERDEQRVLDLLDAVGRRSDLSQRHLASHMGVALGLTNSYLRRCIRKGLIKITSAPANRYLYYLTPKGFSEKSRLTAKFLSTSFGFYRDASRSCADVFERCEEQGLRRVLLCGVSDLAEIAILRAIEAELTVIGVLDRSSAKKKFLGCPVWQALKNADVFDCCVVTDLTTPRQTYRRLIAEAGSERVLVPDILRL